MFADLDDPPDQPYATLLRLVAAHCHPDRDAMAYPRLVLRAGSCTPEMIRFKDQLRDLLNGGPHRLPDGVLYTAAGYDEDDDRTFLRRLWHDLYGDQPP
jgi:hypothetical protein